MTNTQMEPRMTFNSSLDALTVWGALTAQHVKYSVEAMTQRGDDKRITRSLAERAGELAGLAYAEYTRLYADEHPCTCNLGIDKGGNLHAVQSLPCEAHPLLGQ